MTEPPDLLPVLDYEAAPSTRPRRRTRLLLLAGLENAILLVLASLGRDLVALKLAVAFSICYWLIAACILMQRGKSLTRVDALFFVAGPTILFIPLSLLFPL